MTSIAILKPHHGPVGGFERVANWIEGILTGVGHDVTRYTVDLTDTDAVARSRHLEALVADSQREFLTYLHGRDRFDGISTGAYDLVISTSPPSYVHLHRAHLALFSHHYRIFYDLEDLYVAAGFPADPVAHGHAAELVRALDHERFRAVTQFTSTSNTVARRLAHFNGRHDTLPFHAGVGVDSTSDDCGRHPITQTAGALCVTRHEFPKRAELFVAAAHLIDPAIPAVCTGTGGRLEFSKNLDSHLAAHEVTVEQLDSFALWCNTGSTSGPSPTSAGRVDFMGHVDDARLNHCYASTRCVVAPAYDEDYGLTAIEAMRHGRALIVCRDGGGLPEFIEHEETGLIVEPTPEAIAAAITRLHADDDLAARLSANARDRAAELTWSRAADQLLTAVEATLDLAA